MADTVILTSHDAIRDWAAARMGSPAIVDISPEGGVQPMLRLVFDQQSYQDQDRADRPPNAGGYDLVEWDEWFALFDQRKLALEVGPEIPGDMDSWHAIIARPSKA